MHVVDETRPPTAPEPGPRFELRWGEILCYALAIGALIFGITIAPGVGILFLSSFGLTWLLVPSVGRLARRLGAVSLPGGRAINARATERLGGAAVFMPILISLLLLYGLSGEPKALGLAAGSLIVFLLGAVDDIRGLRPRMKVLGQVVAGLCLVLSGFTLEELSFGAWSVELGIFEIPALLFWVVLCTNAFNLVDGMDGLAASLAVLCALAFIAIGAMPAAALVVAGASLGFLRHNLPRAQIFLGDCGSMVLGFLLAALALEVPVEANVAVALGVLAYPLADTTIAISRRFVRGKPLFAADRSHLHHKALEHTGNPWGALFAVLALSVIPMLLAYWNPGPVSVVLTLTLFAIAAGVLVWAGRLRWAAILESRRPLQRIYVVKRYVEDRLDLAVDADEVEQTLRHMTEALMLHVVRLPGVDVDRGPAPDDLETHRVALKGAAATWAAVPEEGILDEERATVVTDLLRTAYDRMCRLASAVDQRNPTDEGGATEVGPSPTREVVAR